MNLQEEILRIKSMIIVTEEIGLDSDKKQKIFELVNVFNDGNFESEIKPYFNDIMTFFKFINKYGLLYELDINNIPYNDISNEVFDYLEDNGILSNFDYDSIPEAFKNNYLIHGLEHNYEDTIKYITSDLLTDVQIRPDGFYLYLGNDRDELASFFCGSSRRDVSAEDVAKQVFSEDGLGNDWYFDVDTKPSDVIDDLDEQNTIHLKDVIFKEIGNVELSLEDYDSDFFESLSQEQGTEGYFKIGPEDLNELIKDSDAINELCKKDLSELGQELQNIYWNAYNSAYENEVYELVYDGLDEYFEGKIDEVPKEITKSDGKKVTKYLNYIKIRDFVGNISLFLENNKGQSYSDSFLEYFGSYSSLMKQLIYDQDYECIDFRTPDYPDWSTTQKYINEMFNDYI
jgi:hypothetical protein